MLSVYYVANTQFLAYRWVLSRAEFQRHIFSGLVLLHCFALLYFLPPVPAYNTAAFVLNKSSLEHRPLKRD